MAPKHVLDLLAVYEAYGVRPRALYVELFHSVVRLSASMYAEEVTLTLQALARYQLGNPTVVAQLIRTVLSQLKEFRLRYLCGVTGALGALRACQPELLTELDARAKYEVDTVPVQELLDNCQSFPLLEYSWKPYEDLCLNEFLQRCSTFRSAEEIDQLVRPFDALLFLQARGQLNNEFLSAVTQWCLRGVHLPNVRSERRPTTRELVLLHDRCRERGIDDLPALQDAIRYFVESGGGIWPAAFPKPLKYKRFGRKYIRTIDPLEGVDLPPLPHELDEDGDQIAQIAPAAEEMSIFGEETAVAVQSASTTSVARRRKPSMSSPELDPNDSTVYCWVTTRKGPRPRRPRDPGLKKVLRKDMPRAPLWLTGGWSMRPKYQPGQRPQRHIGHHYAGLPVGKRGAAWVLRR
eukprot:TRINITY_DN14756_c0_g1_i2.p1 TRINITY_DN14756_c0_g1~~TRINITY_DN14756_c0_g1_i2.p1  ORF type:complete len:454 (+),score=62.07 TRINITY_DN14756_c0_g1_i2:143-1363(+)